LEQAAQGVFAITEKSSLLLKTMVIPHQEETANPFPKMPRCKVSDTYTMRHADVDALPCAAAWEDIFEISIFFLWVHNISLVLIVVMTIFNTSTA
jgi:hypothetical protein